MADDDIPPDFNWSAFLMDDNDFAWVNPDMKNLPEIPGEQEPSENDDLAKTLGDLLDSDPADEVQPIQPWPQQAVDINPYPNSEQEPPENDNVQQMLEDLLDADTIANPVPNRFWPNQQEAVDFNPLRNPGPEPPQIGLHHIEQNPLQDLGQGGGFYVEPVAFQGMDVGQLQEAQHQVAMVQEIPVFTEEEFIRNLILEKEEICNRMMGLFGRRTKPWTMYQTAYDDRYRLDHHFIIEVYSYMNHFIIDEQLPAPIHVRRNCDQATDAATCCFNVKFGAFVENAGNHIHALRQTKLSNMFCADITRVLTKMFQETRTKKAQTGLFPEHVHFVMERWWNNKHNPGAQGVLTYDLEEAILSEQTGLSIYSMRNYKALMPKRRYDFVTKQMVPREPPLPLAPGPAPALALAVEREVGEGQDAPAPPAPGFQGAGHGFEGVHRRFANQHRHPSAEQQRAIIDVINRFPGVPYKNLPPPEKVHLCETCNSTNENMIDWYKRKQDQLARTEANRQQRLNQIQPG